MNEPPPASEFDPSQAPSAPRRGPGRVLTFVVSGALLAGTPGCPDPHPTNPGPVESIPPVANPGPSETPTPTPEAMDKPKPQLMVNPGPNERGEPVTEPEPPVKSNPGPNPGAGEPMRKIDPEEQ